MESDAESQRLIEDRLAQKPWRKWGPYLSERQWGTVREDYSATGAAWDYFPHDHARSRAYRWGEDGIAGISDDQQILCFSLALWNGRDPILKERLFGLTGSEGNHGEDVKELYYYLDATPTHSYLKMLYKYPQAEFPYTQLVEEDRRRSKAESEFELLDTGILNDDRYFDVFIEYAKAGPEDILIRITAHNRGPEAAELHLIPQLFFRNTWSWKPDSDRPSIAHARATVLESNHSALGTYRLTYEGTPDVLFTENETNANRLHGTAFKGRYFKDAFHEYLIANRKDACNPGQHGTKAGLHYHLPIQPGAAATLRFRLNASDNTSLGDFDRSFTKAKREADAFYGVVQQRMTNPDARLVQRQAFAGMIWSKQFYYFDIPEWLNGDPGQPAPPASRKSQRNCEWSHLNNADIISMPDKWEYPWYAAWDLAFHCIPFAQVDPAFAKNQLLLLTREWYMHSNGQLPAYEWAFGDVNPPVHAWATWKVYQIERDQRARAAGLPASAGSFGDRDFLEKVFHKLLLNFTWWVNRKDADGRNIFQGGFLGLDNIGVFDRSSPLPTGGHISQADGTSWMAMYCLNLMRIALELAQTNSVYEDLATKFFEHFLYIAAAMTNVGQTGIDLWDDSDEFFYDVLCVPGMKPTPLKVRSMVGLIPLFAVEVLDPELLAKVPEFTRRLEWFLKYRPDLAKLVSRWTDPGMRDTRLLSLLRGSRMKKVLSRMLDETEFLSDFGVRALSRYHLDHPYVFNANAMNFTVTYQPAESDSGLFGGNSNWRGPIWMPVNFLLIESLRKFHSYYGDDFKVECPTASGNYLTINQVADELSMRLARLFLRNASGQRPLFGDNEKLHRDPHFRDHLSFPEYFHGDSGRGVGASHQTGWTGLIASLLLETQGSVASSKPRPTKITRTSNAERIPAHA